MQEHSIVHTKSKTFDFIILNSTTNRATFCYTCTSKILLQE